MPARSTTLATAVVATINTAAIPGMPVAVRVPCSRFDLASDTTLLDVIIGEDRAWGRLSRTRGPAGWSDSPSIDVVIYAKVPARNVPTVQGDTVAEQAEQIVELFKPLATLAGFQFVMPTMQPLERDWTVELGIAGFVINLKFSDP